MNPLGLLLVGCGVVLLLLGALGQNAPATLDAVPSEVTVWYVVVGSVATVLGLYFVASRAR